jgi:putative intracellular protease/amidase
MVALIFAAAPAKAGDNSIDVAVIVYDGVLTSDITAPLEVFGNAARKPWLHKINVEAVAADSHLDILTGEGIKLKADRLLAEAPRYNAVIVPSRYGMNAVLGNRALIDFIRDQSKTADWIAGNCSGEARWCWPKRAFSTENGQRPGQAAKRRFKRSTRTCLCNTTSTSSLMTAS